MRRSLRSLELKRTAVGRQTKEANRSGELNDTL